jgi:hypothetical protein
MSSESGEPDNGAYDAVRALLDGQWSSKEFFMLPAIHNQGNSAALKASKVKDVQVRFNAVL